MSFNPSHTDQSKQYLTQYFSNALQRWQTFLSARADRRDLIHTSTLSTHADDPEGRSSADCAAKLSDWYRSLYTLATPYALQTEVGARYTKLQEVEAALENLPGWQTVEDGVKEQAKKHKDDVIFHVFAYQYPHGQLEYTPATRLLARSYVEVGS
jgi:hypothetical protein